MTKNIKSRTFMNRFEEEVCFLNQRKRPPITVGVVKERKDMQK